MPRFFHADHLRTTSRGMAVLGVALTWLALGALPTEVPAENGDGHFVPQADPAPDPQPLHFPAIVIRRDPFISDIAAPPDARATFGTSEGPLPVLPPNAGAPGYEPPLDDAEATPLVRAVILGAVPKALIEVAGRSTIVGIGARVSNSTITAITRDGVLLQDGQSLHFQERRP